MNTIKKKTSGDTTGSETMGMSLSSQGMHGGGQEFELKLNLLAYVFEGRDCLSLKAHEGEKADGPEHGMRRVRCW